MLSQWGRLGGKANTGGAMLLPRRTVGHKNAAGKSSHAATQPRGYGNPHHPDTPWAAGMGNGLDRLGSRSGRAQPETTAGEQERRIARTPRNHVLLEVLTGLGGNGRCPLLPPEGWLPPPAWPAWSSSHRHLLSRRGRSPGYHLVHPHRLGRHLRLRGRPLRAGSLEGPPPARPTRASTDESRTYRLPTAGTRW